MWLSIWFPSSQGVCVFLWTVSFLIFVCIRFDADLLFFDADLSPIYRRQPTPFIMIYNDRLGAHLVQSTF